jgi:hypothetical protein
MSNRTEGTRRKLSHTPTGRLKPLRLFSTLHFGCFVTLDSAEQTINAETEATASRK